MVGPSRRQAAHRGIQAQTGASSFDHLRPGLSGQPSDSVDQVSVDQVSVDQVSVDQVSVDQVSVDQVEASGEAAGMSLRWQALCIDSRTPSDTARFWEQALGWRRTYERPDEVVLEPPAGSREEGAAPDLLFLLVPEGKELKNRLHLDLRPVDRDAEVVRLEALGASRVDVGQDETATWVVLADPEGNEFCVLRAPTPEELD